MDGALLTLDQLTDWVAQALADGYPGAPTARVRDLPDQRTIRWYVTRGLVDPPLAMRDRRALYGERHVLQLVAIKRRQAEGRSLAEIQAELLGATTATLASIASLPAQGTPQPARFAATVSPAAASSPAAGPRLRFWAAPATAREADPPSLPQRPLDRRPDPSGDGAAPDVRAFRLAAGITLVVEGGGPEPDSAVLRAAARPLLDLLTPATRPPATAAGKPHDQPHDQPEDAAGQEKGSQP